MKKPSARELRLRLFGHAPITLKTFGALAPRSFLRLAFGRSGLPLPDRRYEAKPLAMGKPTVPGDALAVKGLEVFILVSSHA